LLEFQEYVDVLIFDVADVGLGDEKVPDIVQHRLAERQIVVRVFDAQWFRKKHVGVGQRRINKFQHIFYAK
jgi:hypothetical protein